MIRFVFGMTTMGYVIAGIFFTKFWVRSGDLLFAAFAAAFGLLAVNEASLAISEWPAGAEGWLFLLRLAAFSLIVVAIIHKNAAGGSDAG